MATCFRSVSGKLCCSNYFKAASVIYTENNSSALQKPSQQLNVPNKWSYSRTSNVNAIPEVKFLGLHDAPGAKSNLIPFKPATLSPYELCLGYRSEIAIKLPTVGVSNCERSVLLAVDKGEDASERVKPTPESQGRPSAEKLEVLFNDLSKTLPKIFISPLNPENYHKDIILENNITGKRFTGLRQYMTQVAFLRMLAHFKFAQVKYEILKITKHPEDGTIKCRWRIKGVPALHVFIFFWRFTPFNIHKVIDESPVWHDGFSIYYVGSNGQVIKHIIDKMQPDDDRLEVNSKSSIAPKVALFAGLLPQQEEITCP